LQAFVVEVFAGLGHFTAYVGSWLLTDYHLTHSSATS